MICSFVGAKFSSKILPVVIILYKKSAVSIEIEDRAELTYLRRRVIHHKFKDKVIHDAPKVNQKELSMFFDCFSHIQLWNSSIISISWNNVFRKYTKLLMKDGRLNAKGLEFLFPLLFVNRMQKFNSSYLRKLIQVHLDTLAFGVK